MLSQNLAHLGWTLNIGKPPCSPCLVNTFWHIATSKVGEIFGMREAYACLEFGIHMGFTLFKLGIQRIHKKNQIGMHTSLTTGIKKGAVLCTRAQMDETLKAEC